VGSTYVYQGWVRELGAPAVQRSLELLDFLRLPDLTIVLDRPLPHSSFTFDRNDLFESEGLRTWQSIREGFLACAQRFGWSIVDAEGSVDEVSARVWELVEGIGA
jgi:thymidylate kinase